MYTTIDEAVRMLTAQKMQELFTLYGIGDNNDRISSIVS